MIVRNDSQHERIGKWETLSDFESGQILVPVTINDTLWGVLRATVSRIVPAYTTHGNTISAKENSGKQSALIEREIVVLWKGLPQKSHNYCRTDDSNFEIFWRELEVHEIISNLNPKKSLGYDFIAGKILKELPIIGIKYLTNLFNAVLLKGYFRTQWKVAQINLISKPGKPPNELTT
jgi:hypothetical protein